MNHLAIDTSTNICSVSLYCNSKYNTMKKEDISDHSEYLPIFVNKLLSNDVIIDFIALNIGPGSFTGLKIGCSFAKGLAKALNIPIVPIATFEALKNEITSLDYFLSIYSHRDFSFYTKIQNGVMGEHKCDKISNFKDEKVFGYGFPKDLNVNYKEIKPCSEKVSIIALEKYNDYKDKSIDSINPIYLMQNSK